MTNRIEHLRTAISDTLIDGAGRLQNLSQREVSKKAESWLLVAFVVPEFIFSVAATALGSEYSSVVHTALSFKEYDTALIYMDKAGKAFDFSLKPLIATGVQSLYSLCRTCHRVAIGNYGSTVQLSTLVLPGLSRLMRATGELFSS